MTSWPAEPEPGQRIARTDLGSTWEWTGERWRLVSIEEDHGAWLLWPALAKGCFLLLLAIGGLLWLIDRALRAWDRAR